MRRVGRSGGQCARQCPPRVGRHNLARGWIGDADAVLELLWLLLMAVLVWVRPRQALVLENLLPRHQLAVLTRPTRPRPRARLRTWDKLLWVLARRFCAGWREHLAFVTPDTVVRWHRQGWRLFWRWKSHARGGRPHRRLGLQTPGAKLRPVTGPIWSRPVLNGLHHVCERAA